MVDKATIKRLIELIKPYECLYNGELNMNIVQTAWALVEMKLNDNTIDVREVWKHIKYKYRQSRSYRKCFKKARPYYLEEELAFFEIYVNVPEIRCNETALDNQNNPIFDSSDEIEAVQEDSYEQYYNIPSTSQQPIVRNPRSAIQMNAEMSLHYNLEASGVSTFSETSHVQGEYNSPSTSQPPIARNSRSAIQINAEMSLHYNLEASGFSAFSETSRVQGEYNSPSTSQPPIARNPRNSIQMSNEMSLLYNPDASGLAAFSDTSHVQRQIIPNSTHASDESSCSPQEEPLDLSTQEDPREISTQEEPLDLSTSHTRQN